MLNVEWVKIGMSVHVLLKELACIHYGILFRLDADKINFKISKEN